MAEFLNGEFEIVDEGSQLSGMKLAVQNGENILDFNSRFGEKSMLAGFLLQVLFKKYLFFLTNFFLIIEYRKYCTL